MDLAQRTLNRAQGVARLVGFVEQRLTFVLAEARMVAIDGDVLART